ncbi:uncharacterized protein LOC114432318 [Parambassis ranga]|uniref:Uncharacterized protein LOC114432318 n=1 Tax=Parambassis ranga TaxID=210632 RepID=A0A6P7HQQ6_9TELE|nr:uncharacterized protein LOC114432318 [Parambassis ranga]
MACGLCLGIVLICLVQAEHVCCLWARDAQSSQIQNGNAYVGFSQQDGRYGGTYPQNEFRQALDQSLSVGNAANGGYYPTKMYSRPHQSSVKIAHSNPLSNHNWRITKFISGSQRKPFPGLFSDLASGSSLIKCNGVTHVMQGTPSSTKYLLSSVQSPFREGFHSNQHVAPKPPTADAPAYYSQTGSSRLFSQIGPPVPDRPPAQMQTSASAPARRVSTHHASEPSTRTTYTLTDARKPHISTLFPSFIPANSNHQTPRTRYSAQGTHHFPASVRIAAGTSSQMFAPTQIYRIPQRFGGYDIRRLKEPAVQQCQTPISPPPQQGPTYLTQGPSVHQGVTWRRFKPHPGH